MGNESIEKPPLDISEAFLGLSVHDFSEKLRELHDVPALKIAVDLSLLDDRQKFRIQTRRLKAFLETKLPIQKRVAIVRLKREQIQWEPNVFSSGVKAEFID